MSIVRLSALRGAVISLGILLAACSPPAPEVAPDPEEAAATTSESEPAADTAAIDPNEISPLDSLELPMAQSCYKARVQALALGLDTRDPFLTPTGETLDTYVVVGRMDVLAMENMQRRIDNRAELAQSEWGDYIAALDEAALADARARASDSDRNAVLELNNVCKDRWGPHIAQVRQLFGVQ